MEQAKRGGPEMPLTIVFVERKTRCDEVRWQAAACRGRLRPARLPDARRQRLAALPHSNSLLLEVSKSRVLAQTTQPHTIS